MSDIINVAKKFIQKVKMSGIPVSQAYLFGSYAKGKPKPYSDIDICIVSPALGKDFISEMVKFSQISRDVDNRIETIPFNSARLNDPYDPLAAEIRRTGILIA